MFLGRALSFKFSFGDLCGNCCCKNGSSHPPLIGISRPVRFWIARIHATRSVLLFGPLRDLCCHCIRACGPLSFYIVLFVSTLQPGYHTIPLNLALNARQMQLVNYYNVVWQAAAVAYSLVRPLAMCMLTI